MGVELLYEDSGDSKIAWMNKLRTIELTSTLVYMQMNNKNVILGFLPWLRVVIRRGNLVRNCIRCKEVLEEGYNISIEGKLYGIRLTKDKPNKIFKKVEIIKVAVCPKCGEVSLYK